MELDKEGHTLKSIGTVPGICPSSSLKALQWGTKLHCLGIEGRKEGGGITFETFGKCTRVCGNGMYGTARCLV